MVKIATALIAVSLCITGWKSRSHAGDEVQPDTSTSKANSERIVYKEEPRRTLTIYYPDGWQATDKRPALVIFRCNIPAQRERFRSLGMVIIEPQLAAVNHGLLPGASLEEITKMPRPRNQLEDTKSALRFIRQQAGQLGIHPERIVATGTSGGGDLALQAFLNRSFEDLQDDRSVSPHPNALVLYCPAFDGINIWFVKSSTIIARTKQVAPSFLPWLNKFIENTTDEYAMPLDHRADLIAKADTLGKEKGIEVTEIKAFQAILELFNKSDWQLLQPIEDELQMCASRLLTDEPLPPTLIMYGTRDHLFEHQTAFVNKAKQMGKQFDLKIFEGGGHSFMMQPAFLEPSNQEVERFLTKLKYLPYSEENN